MLGLQRSLEAEITETASLRESRCSEDCTKPTFFYTPPPSCPNMKPRKSTRGCQTFGGALQRPHHADSSDLCSSFVKEEKDGFILRTYEGYIFQCLSKFLL